MNVAASACDSDIVSQDFFFPAESSSQSFLLPSTLVGGCTPREQRLCGLICPRVDASARSRCTIPVRTTSERNRKHLN